MTMDNLGRYRKLLVVSCFSSAALFLFVSVATVAYPHDLDLYEGNLFVPAERIALGQSIYGQGVVLAEPFIYATYGPVYYLVLGVFLRLTGLAFWPGRLISLLATAATALVIYRTVKRHAGDKLGPLAASGLFIMMPSTWAFGSLQRVDALGVFFSAFAITLSLSFTRRRDLAIAGGAAALAILTKPTIIAGAVAVVTWLVFTRRLKELAMFSLGAAGVLVIAGIAMILTGNEGYLFNVSSAQIPFHFRYLVVNVRGLVQSHVVFVSLVIAAIILTRFRLAELDASVSLLLIYLIAGGMVGLITCGRTGASINYFYEFTTALALLAGFGFSKLASDDLRFASAGACILLAMAISTEMVFFRVASIQGRWLLPLRKAPLHAMLVRDLETFVPQQEPIVSDYQDVILRTGHRLYFNDWTMYRIASQPMQACLRSYLSEKRLGAIITHGETQISGYRLVDGYGFSDPNSTSGIYSAGPFLYLREDLWQKRAQLIGQLGTH